MVLYGVSMCEVPSMRDVGSGCEPAAWSRLKLRSAGFVAYGLQCLEHEVWQGFLLRAGGP